MKFIEDDESPAPEKGLLEKGADMARSALHGAVGAIPGGDYAAAKIAGALGDKNVPAEKAELDKLSEENPISHAVGTLGGAALLPAAGAETLAGKIAAGAAQGAILQPAYKLGETANQAALKGQKITAEMIEHSFDFHDMLEAAGIGGVLSAGLHGVGGLVGSVVAKAGPKAEAEAAKLFPKTAKRGMADVGKRALDEGVLVEPAKAEALLARSGKQIEKHAAKAQLDSVFFEDLGQKMQPVLQQAQGFEALQPIVKKVGRQLQSMVKNPDAVDGTKFQAILSDMKADARSMAKHPQRQEFLNDAAKAMEDHFVGHLDNQDPGAGLDYKAALSDYRIYSAFAEEAKSAAKKVLKPGEAATEAGKLAGATAAGSAIGGPVGGGVAMAADLAYANGKLRSMAMKNKALLWKSISEMGPSQRGLEKIKATAESLLTGTRNSLTKGIGLDDSNVDEHYDKVVAATQSAMADPDGISQRLGDHLTGLDPMHALGVSANLTNKLQATGVEAPQNTGPQTAFGFQTGISERAKKDFLRKTEAKFDPYAAVASGRADLIREAEKHNPETVNAIKQEIIRRMQTDKNMSYSTKRRLAGILGLPGTPVQDPALGGALQQIINTKRGARDTQGQMESSRQMNAQMKNNSATLTRAQRLMNSNGKQ